MGIEDILAVDGADAPTDALMVGGKVFTGVPVELADGKLAAPWLDEFRRLVAYAFSFTSEAFEIDDIAPAHFAPFAPVAMAQLAAPGETDPIEVRPFNRASCQIVLANANTSVTVRLNGSHDGTLYFPLPLEDVAVAGLTISGAQATITADGPYYLVTPPIATRYVDFEFVSEAGGTDATLDVTLKAKT
jgi:hypothetical protein